MAVNVLGLVAGATAFLSIWAGHVTVRRVEARAVRLWQPMLAFLLLGLGCELGALLSTDRTLSMVLGIAGFSLLWDVLELRRQERRVRKGHAPANPENPRHVALLAGATTGDAAPGGHQLGHTNGEPRLAEIETLAGKEQA